MLVHKYEMLPHIILSISFIIYYIYFLVQFRISTATHKSHGLTQFWGL